MTAPIRDVPIAGETVLVLRRHQDFAEIFRIMKERLGLTNKFLDDAGNFADGQTDKYLGPSATKNLGPETFDYFCEVLAIEFHARIDMDALKRMEAIYDAKAPRWFPNAKVGRISRKLIERAKPEIYRENARAGGKKRAANLPAKLRSQIARKAGKASGRARRQKAKRARCAEGKQTIIAQASSCTPCTST